MIEHSEELCGAGDIVREARQRWADDTIAFVNAEPEPLAPWAREARHGAFIVRDLLKQSAGVGRADQEQAQGQTSKDQSRDATSPSSSRFCSSHAVVNKAPHVCELYADHRGEHQCRLHNVTWPSAPESIRCEKCGRECAPVNDSDMPTRVCEDCGRVPSVPA
jgi:hypothetical protein